VKRNIIAKDAEDAKEEQALEKVDDGPEHGEHLASDGI
jgi:hypothetical protein